MIVIEAGRIHVIHRVIAAIAVEIEGIAGEPGRVGLEKAVECDVEIPVPHFVETGIGKILTPGKEETGVIEGHASFPAPFVIELRRAT